MVQIQPPCPLSGASESQVSEVLLQKSGKLRRNLSVAGNETCHLLSMNGNDGRRVRCRQLIRGAQEDANWKVCATKSDGRKLRVAEKLAGIGKGYSPLTRGGMRGLYPQKRDTSARLPVSRSVILTRALTSAGLSIA